MATMARQLRLFVALHHTPLPASRSSQRETVTMTMSHVPLPSPPPEFGRLGGGNGPVTKAGRYSIAVDFLSAVDWRYCVANLRQFCGRLAATFAPGLTDDCVSICAA